MVIAAERIMALNQGNNIIEGLPSEGVELHGLGIPVRVSGAYKLIGEGKLEKGGITLPLAQKVVAIADNDLKVEIAPGTAVLLKTIEKVNIPQKKLDLGGDLGSAFLVARVDPSPAFHNSGLVVSASLIEPGFSGNVTIWVVNVSAVSFELWLGTQIATLVFDTVEGDIGTFVQTSKQLETG